MVTAMEGWFGADTSSCGKAERVYDIDAITPVARQQLFKWADRAKDRVAKRKLENGRSLLMPDSAMRAVWDFMNLVLLTWTTFEIPVSMLFMEHAPEYDNVSLGCKWDAFMIINLIVDTLFLIDVLVSFNTAYLDKNAILVDDRRAIACNYMKSWFLLDVSTSIPLDQILCTLRTGDGDIVRLIKIFRLLKLARILRFVRILKKWEMITGSKTVRNVSRMSKFVALMIFVTHMSACMWMVPVMHGECAPHSDDFLEGACTNWLDTYDPRLAKPGVNWARRYLASMYFAIVTLCTVGYGDIVPTNDLERVFAGGLALCGGVIFAFCIGSISSLANQESATEFEIDAALRSLHDFLQYNNMNLETQQHVKQHLLFTARTTPHLVHRCLDLLPRRLRCRIIEHSVSGQLRQVPIFSGMDLESRSFIAQFLKPTFLPAGEFLFQALETGMEMYFIIEGELEVLNVTEVRIMCRLRKGDFVGEIALFPNLITYRTSSVRAAKHSLMFELSRQDLEQHIRLHFPDIYESIREIANVRFRWLDIDPLGA
jgi:hypothetical protein